MTRIDVPVLIVGGGPAGLTASLLLSRHGVDSLLVERHADASPLPRARGVHARAMEILRVCEVEADMRRVELPIRGGAEWRPTLGGPVVNSMEFGGGDEAEVSPCDGIAVSQDVFESVIRDHARSYSRAALWLGWEMESLTLQDGAADAVLVDLASGTRREVRARYVVAADGSRGGIRAQLGIGMDGDADLGGQRMIAFRADLRPITGARPRGIYFLIDSSAALFWTHPDDRWVLSIPDRGDAVDDAVDGTDADADAESTVRRALGDADIEIAVLAAKRWTAAAETATRFAQDQVFLVGDAAHRTPPVGATGVSSAMHDVHNLAWKLAAVLDGRAGPALLATYDQERGPEARRTTAEMRHAWIRFWEPDSAPPTGRGMRAIDMGYRYRSTAVVPDGTLDDAGPDDYVPSAAPGGRAPHTCGWTPTGASRQSTCSTGSSCCSAGPAVPPGTGRPRRPRSWDHDAGMGRPLRGRRRRRGARAPGRARGLAITGCARRDAASGVGPARRDSALRDRRRRPVLSAPRRLNDRVGGVAGAAEGAHSCAAPAEGRHRSEPCPTGGPACRTQSPCRRTTRSRPSGPWSPPRAATCPPWCGVRSSWPRPS